MLLLNFSMGFKQPGAWKKESLGFWNFALVAQLQYEVTSGISHEEGMHCGCF